MQNHERKVRKIKKAIKNLVVENSALCDHIADIQEQIDVVKQERQFLLRKFVEHEPAAIDLVNQNEPPIKYKKRKNSSSDASSINKPLKRKYKVQERLSKKKAQSPIPKLPVDIDGIILLHSLGRIVADRPAYHNDNCIYPVSYRISRTYNGKTFMCRIVDNGLTPLFEATVVGDSNFSFSGHSTDDVHAEILQTFDNCNVPYILDGDSFYGLTNRKIKEYIQLLPAARKLMRIKQEIKQENSSFFDDNARNFLMNSTM